MLKFLKGLLIFVVVIVVLVVAAVFTVANLTPNQLKLGDYEIYEGNSLNDLGLGDTKFKEVYYLYKDLSNVEEDKIVTNGYDATEEKTTAETTLEDSNIPKNTSGEPDYTSIVTTPVTYDNKYVINYSDTTLAYIFDSIISQGSQTSSSDANINFLKDLNANIDEFTITDKTTYFQMRLVMSIETSAIKNQINEALGSFASYVTLPERLYIVSYNKLSADNKGVLTTTSESIKINDSDNQVSQVIFQVLAKNISGSSSDNDSDAINNVIGSAFSSIVSNLGKVGTATTLTNNIANPLTIAYGPSGISAHKLTLITNTVI